MDTPDASALAAALTAMGCTLVGHRDRDHGSPELWEELEQRYGAEGPLHALVMVIPTFDREHRLVVVCEDIDPPARAWALDAAHHRLTATPQTDSGWLVERGLRLCPVFGTGPARRGGDEPDVMG